MFEGKNEIKFSKKTAETIIGQYLTKLFGVPIEVTKLETGSYSATVDVTFEEVRNPETKGETDTVKATP